MPKVVDALYTQHTVQTTFGDGIDSGFTTLRWKLELVSGAGPVEYSFDGTNTHGILGPAGTRSRVVEDIRATSRVWLKSAVGGELVDVWAR